MNRRSFLATSGALGVGSLAGCMGFGLQESGGEPALVENRPDAVYYPTHVEGMVMAGMKKQGDYACALTYSFPHRFWLVTGQRRKKVTVQSNDTMHVMPVVWDRETKIVPPDISPQLKISQDGEQVTSVAPWPMLSQPMGFHFGDNIKLPGEGTYQVEAQLASLSTKRTGSLADRSSETPTFSFEMAFGQQKLDGVMFRDIPADKQGTKGAVPPMDMKMMPVTQVPKPDDLPGTVRGSGTSGDANFVVTTLTDATRFGGNKDEAYVAVSPRTPYNRYMLPMMSLSGTLTRNGETVYDDVLTATIDPDLGYHYGAAVSSVKSGDTLTVTVDAPPQTARHEGYETAFVEMTEVKLDL